MTHATIVLDDSEASRQSKSVVPPATETPHLADTATEASHRLARDRARQKARRARLKAAGLCVLCGGVPANHGIKCGACVHRWREADLARAKKRRVARMAAGLCHTCGRQPEPGYIGCFNCRRGINRSPDAVENARIHCRERTANFLAAGLCGVCGRNPLDTKYRCRPCANRNAAQALAYYHETKNRS